MFLVIDGVLRMIDLSDWSPGVGVDGRDVPSAALLSRCVRLSMGVWGGKLGPRVSQLNYDRFMVRDWEFWYQLGCELGIEHGSLKREHDENVAVGRSNSMVIDASERVLSVYARLRVGHPEVFRTFSLLVGGKTVRQIVRADKRKSIHVHREIAFACEYFARWGSYSDITRVVDFAGR